MKNHTPEIKSNNISATHIFVIITGIVGGFISIEHGIFEVLQGTTPTESMVIEAIGPAQRFEGGVGEMAITILPNFLLTGIVAIIIGLLTIIWVSKFIDQKYGSLGLFILSIMTLFLGGGVAFFLIALINCIVATRIHKPLNWWEKHLSVKIRLELAKHLVLITISFVLLFILTLVIAIFGLRFIGINDVNQLATILGLITTLIYLFSVISCFSFDIQNHLTNPA